MSYSLSTGQSYMQHLQTRSEVRAAGRSTEIVLHRGLMALATSQAKAMKGMEERLEDRIEGEIGAVTRGISSIGGKLAGMEDSLVRIDAEIAKQTKYLSAISDSLQFLTWDVNRGFDEVSATLSRIESKRDNIDYKVSHPEEMRALERFKTALEYSRRGHHAGALERIAAAIENDGGPSFEHMPEFHVLCGDILLGIVNDPDLDLVDVDAAQAAYQKACHWYDDDRPELIERMAFAHYAAGDPKSALDAYRQLAGMQRFNAQTQLRILGCSMICASTEADPSFETATQAVEALLENSLGNIALIASDPDCIAHHSILGPMLDSELKYRSCTGPVAMRSMGTWLTEWHTTINAKRSALHEMAPDREGVTNPHSAKALFPLIPDCFLLSQESLQKIEHIAGRNVPAFEVHQMLTNLNQSDETGAMPLKAILAMVMQVQKETRHGIAAVNAMSHEDRERFVGHTDGYLGHVSVPLRPNGPPEPEPFSIFKWRTQKRAKQQAEDRYASALAAREAALEKKYQHQAYNHELRERRKAEFNDTIISALQDMQDMHHHNDSEKAVDLMIKILTEVVPEPVLDQVEINDIRNGRVAKLIE